MAERKGRELGRGAFADRGPPGKVLHREWADTVFKDQRLANRFRTLLEQLGGNPGESIPLACQDWANTKAAYRFFDNDRVSEAEILDGHFQSTRERVAAADGPILVLHARPHSVERGFSQVVISKWRAK